MDPHARPMPEHPFGAPAHVVTDCADRAAVRSANHTPDIVGPCVDALIGHGVSGEIVSWSSDATRLFGWTAQEAVGQDTRLLVPDGQRAAENDRWQRACSGEAPEWQPATRLHKNGQILQVSVRMSPMLDGSGTTIGVVSHASVRDALGSSELRLHRMAEVITIGVGLKQIDPPEYLYANPAFYEILGLDPSAPRPRFEQIASMIHPDDRQAAATASVGAESGAITQQELRLTRPDGDPRWIRFTSSPVTDDQGIVIRVASTVEDVTAAKNAEIALRHSEERFRQMAASLEVGFILREIGERSFAYTSPAFLRMFGFDEARSALAFEEVTSLIHLDDLPAAASAAARVESGEIVQQELRMTPHDGDPRWIRFTSSPVTDEQGTVIRVAATVEDVTATKLAEIALRDSEKRFRRTAGALDFGISLRQTAPPKFLYVNEKYIQIVGFDPTAVEEAPVESALRHIHPDDRDGVMADYWRRAAIGQPAQADLRTIQPSGEVRWLRVTSHPVESEPGTGALTAGTIEDITPRKIAEAAVESARRDAESANRAKSEFLSRMSHELRTPLNAVLGFAQLLEMDAVSEKQLSAVGHILRGGRHLLGMINDLMDISRIETDQLELSIEPVAVADVLSETVGLMRPTATLNGIQLGWDSGQPHSDLHVLADRRRLRQVVLNLLSNAIKYNQHQGSVEVRCERPDRSHLTVAITDTGIGMRATDLHRLFNPFDRLGQQTSDIEGAGIGLALSKRLVAIMGGRLEVESTLGSGSTFTIVLPLALEPAGNHEQGKALDGTHAPVTGPVATLLYVEDNQSNVELMSRILDRRPGWRLVHAGDGEAGLQQTTIVRPALVFLDLHLPDLNGIDVLRALRADPASADIPVVVVSADASPGQIELLRNAGAQHYLTKPFDVPEVFRLLDLHAPAGAAE